MIFTTDKKMRDGFPQRELWMFKQKLKRRLHRTLLGNVLEGYRIKKAYGRWLRNGKSITVAYAVKQHTVKQFAKKYGIRVFIEVGTYLGDMAAAVCNDFDRIYSIELSEDLFNRAAKKFAGYKHIAILHGDSFQVMPEILRRIEVPCLFWLNGHYSLGNSATWNKEGIMMEELKQIIAHPIKNHVILIDEANLFAGKNDFPTLEFMRTFVESRTPYYGFYTQNDIIRIYKKP
jgi:hypothetical protein